MNTLKKHIQKQIHHNYEYLYRYLGILDIKRLYQYKIANYMHRCIINPPCKEIVNLICNKKISVYDTRRSGYWDKPQFTLQLATNCISWQAPTMYNSIPTYLKEILNYGKFKKILKNHMLCFQPTL